MPRFFVTHSNDTKSAVSVFLHGDILTDPNLGDGDVHWSDSYEYFEGQFDRDLTSGNISYFLIRAQTDEHSVPPGAHRIGVVGYVVGDFNFPWPSEVEALEAYVVTSNWVNYATPSTRDLVRSDGISYTRAGNTGPDWDAAYIGDFIQIDVRETDLISVSVENGETTTGTQSDTRNVEFTGSIGRTFGAELGGISTENNSSAGFTFGTSSTTTNQVTSSTQYTISSERLGNNNTFELRYQDVADRSQYPSYRHLFVVENASTFGLGNEFSYGHNPEERSTWDRDPFSLTPSSNLEEPYQLLGEEGGPLRFINVIRKPDDE